MATVRASITDSAIKRHLLASDSDRIRDPKLPLEVRFRACRTKGSFFALASCGGKTKRHKLGDWPLLSAKAALGMLPSVVSALVRGERVTTSSFQCVGDVLRWYGDRALSDKALSDKRRGDIKNTLDKHLLPCLGAVMLENIDTATIDQLLLWPMQQKFKPSTCRTYFAVLKRAFNRAVVLGKMNRNPVADIKFSTFISAPIKPRGSRLTEMALPVLIERFADNKRAGATLCWLMLAHGTRIGETRQLQWQHVDMVNRRIYIPAELTKTRQPHLIPLTDYALARLTAHKKRQAQTGYTGGFLFPYADGGAVSAALACAWVSAVSGGDWSAHDLRKLARTCWADLGIDYLIGERLLNHAPSKLDQAYIHTHLEAKKFEALELWHEKMKNIDTALKKQRSPLTYIDTERLYC